jgi:hypothetical protein
MTGVKTWIGEKRDQDEEIIEVRRGECDDPEANEGDQSNLRKTREDSGAICGRVLLPRAAEGRARRMGRLHARD